MLKQSEDERDHISLTGLDMSTVRYPSIVTIS